MIGAGWPVEAPQTGVSGTADLIATIVGFALLIAFAAIVVWRGRPRVHEPRAEPHFEHPADFRKAA